MLGRTLSHYKILEQIGAGGMGVVYRAFDERLEREVALKVIPPGSLSDEASRKRFRKEALALSKLNHPNIGTVHDFDTQDGVDFLVMELVRGETLSRKLAEGALPEAELAGIGLQLAEGLAAAHREGILHRDIKPGNLLLTTDGRLKILDFGLAKLTRHSGARSSTQTASFAGQAVGTLPYMSPEQLQGKPVDVRSDLYSAGAVLYEMACGRRAFPQREAEPMIVAILGQMPPAPRGIAPDTSPDLEVIIMRCLAKNRNDRYESAEALAADLHQLELPGDRRRKKSVLVPALAVLAFLGLGACAVAFNVGGVRDLFPGASPRIRSLAVLPLANLSGDPSQEFFADGMTDELITRLSQIAALRVIARSSVMQYKGSKKPLGEIAKELGVGAVVEGSVIRAGDMVRITAELVDPKSQRNLWADSYERSVSNVLSLQSEVARAVVDRIAIRLTPGERVRLASAPAVDPRGHEEYLKGTFELNRFTSDGFLSARDHFLRSIEIDPGYAPAHAGLAYLYASSSNLLLPPKEAMPHARASANAALALDSTLAEAHGVLGYVRAFYDWDWPAAGRELRRAIDLFPGSAIAHQDYAFFLTVTGRFDEAENEFREAHDLDPLNDYISSQLLWPLYEGRSYERAIDAARDLLRINPNQFDVEIVLGESYMKMGIYEKALDAFRRARALEMSPVTTCYLAYAFAKAGRPDSARVLLRELESKGSFVPGYSLAIVHLGLGDKGRAIQLLEQGLEERAEEMVFLKVDPILDPLRSDPRFHRLLHEMAFDKLPA